ncbi:MAG TPA: FixH family protein [Terracidiphilus sp.]|jgi:hypothetical protein|nr:FixH family protein [Terracidiphilus sp.]
MLAATLTFTVTACHGHANDAPGISLQESIAPQPVRVGAATVTMRLFDTSGHSLEHARIQIEGDMDHPGMEPVFSNAQETAPGTYSAPLTFTMGGDWVVLAHITLADGRKIERQWDVKGVESH